MVVTSVDFVIITALDEERDAVAAKLPDCRRLAPSEDDIRVYYRSDLPITFADGATSTYSVILTSLTNMTNPYATATAGDAIRRWQPRCVLLVGIAGGVAANDVSLGDVLVSDQIVDYRDQKATAGGRRFRFRGSPVSGRLLAAARNVDARAWRRLIKKRRPTPGTGKSTTHIGPVATSDTLVADEQLLGDLLHHYPKLIGMEMEAGGTTIATHEAASRPEFFMVRGVSDLADDKRASDEVKTWRPYACHVAAAFAVALLESGPIPPSSGERHTFTTTDHFFRPSLDPNHLYHHGWSFVGRGDVLETLHAFVASERHRVAILPGRGGIGKTKLLHAFAQGFDARHPGVALRFMREGILVAPESRDDMPAPPSVIVVDDAHRRTDVATLCAIAQEGPRRIKLILATRPHGLGAIESLLVHGNVDTREILPLDSLTSLKRGDVKDLARQALGAEHGHLADRLAAVTKDSPLVTVIGGRLLAERAISPAELERDAEFRIAVLGRFTDELVGHVDDRIDPAFCRALLALCAAVAPVNPDDEEFLEAAAVFLVVDKVALLQGIDALERAGILLRRGYTIRVTPDVLADHILHEACLTEHGRPTGYAQRIFDRFAPTSAARVLGNLGELEWRVHRATGRESDVLADVWRTIGARFVAASHRGRLAILRSLVDVAFYQPVQVLHLVTMAMRHPSTTDDDDPFPSLGFHLYTHEDVLRALPPLLGRIGYRRAHLPRCCDLLWQIGRDDPRPVTHTPEHAIRVLRGFAGYDTDRSLASNWVVVEAVERWLRKPDAHRHRQSPLDVLDPLLAKVVTANHQEGGQVVLQAFLLDRAAIRPIRERAIGIITRCAVAAADDVAVTVRCLRSLKDALADPMPYYGLIITPDDIAGWVPEQREILDLLAELASTLTHPLARLYLTDMLLPYTLSKRDDIARAAWDIHAALLESFELRLARALFPSYNARLMEAEAGPPTEPAERWRRQEQAQHAVAAGLVARCPDPAEGAAILNSMLTAVPDGFDPPVLMPFVQALAGLHEGYIAGLCDSVVAAPDCPLAPHLRTLFSGVRAYEPDRAATLVRRIVDEGHVGLCQSILFVYQWGGDLLPADVPIIQALLASDSPAVRRDAVAALRGMRTTTPRRAIALACAVDIGQSEEFAHALCGLFDPLAGIPLAEADDGEVATLVNKLEPIPSLDDPHVGQFLTDACARLPRLVVGMLLRRVARANSDPVPGYQAFPEDGQHVDLGALARSEDYEDMLRDIYRAARAQGVHPFSSLPHLFRRASARYDERSMSVVTRWIDGEDAQGIRTVGDLLRAVPSSFIFTHRDAVVHLLEQAYDADDDCYAYVAHALKSTVQSRSRQRVIGGLDPKDVALHRQATEIATAYAHSWPVSQFYTDITREADASMRQAQKEDEAYEDDA